MSTRRVGWRHLGQLLVGLAIGAICLVMWSSSSASALDAPAPAAPVSTTVDHVVHQVTAPVGQLLAPGGVALPPVVAPVTDGVLGPTLAVVETALAGLARALPPAHVVPTLPDVPG